MHSAPTFLEIDALAHAYADDLALQSITLAVGEGEFAAIVGPSGCGKTTILKVIAGLLRPTAGRFRIKGQDVQGPQGGLVGMAFQNPTMLPWLTVLENVLIPLHIVAPYKSEWGSRRKYFESRGQELLKTVGLKGWEQKRTWELSGGMLQRLSLCRALIHEPRLLLIDEPFGALDTFTREDLWVVLQELFLKNRPTVILVTHDLREAVYLADTVYIMSQRPGRIVDRTISPFPRPRTIALSYGDHFTEITAALRAKVGEAHQTSNKANVA